MKIDVVIPVKNGYPEIIDCIDGILSQTVKVRSIIIIDSGSTDNSLSYLEKIAEVKIVKILPSTFNHGETRNIGWQQSDSDYIIFTVQDAKACNKYWIEELLKGFTDEEVVGVCGQQIVPHENNKNPVDWFRPISEPQLNRYQFKDASQFEALTPLEKKNVCGWDDVTAMYRNDILKQIPFKKTSYCEDAVWAKDAIMNGCAIVYNNKARVYHYHFEDEKYTFRQCFTAMYFHFRNFHFLYPKPELKIRSKMSIIKTLFKSCRLNLNVILYWYRYNINKYRVRLKAYEYFMQCLSSGEMILDAEHEKLCGKPPSPMKLN